MKRERVKILKIRLRFFSVFFIFPLLISACVRTIAPADVLKSTPVPYIPVTLEPPTPVFTPTVATPTMSPLVNQPGCDSVLSFLGDVTVPDDSYFSPGEKIEKKWKVRNDGDCNWIEGYKLALTEGMELGAEKTQPLTGIASNTETIITIIFTAPDTPGMYYSGWNAMTPSGHYFGDPLYLQIVVE